jgi:hypothetical protein
MKKILVSSIAVMVCLCLAASPAWAGSKQRHRWEGVAIGLGAAIVGSALVNAARQPNNETTVANPNQTFNYTPAQPHVYAPSMPSPPPVYQAPPQPQCPRGHWETRKTWIPETYRRAWNPAHYNRQGRWVPGGWIEIVDQEGRWVEERVWVGRR